MKKFNKASKIFILVSVILALSVMLSCVAFGAEANVVKNYSEGAEPYAKYIWNVKYINLVNNFDGLADEGVISSWDVSENEDGSVKAWIKVDSAVLPQVTAEDSVIVLPHDVRCELFIGAEGKIKAPADMSYFFAEFDNVEKITGLEFLDTSAVTTMKGMFSGCINLKEIDISALDTENVTDMSFMFYGCERISKINFTDVNTSNVIYMNQMFSGCKNIVTLNLSSFNVEKVLDTQNMFLNCERLVTLYTGKQWVFLAIQNSENMFMNCYSIVGKIAYDSKRTDVRYSTADYYATDAKVLEEEEIVKYITDTLYVDEVAYALDYVGHYAYNCITSYKSDNPEVVAVSADGGFKALAPGRAQIYTTLSKKGTITFVIDVIKYPVQPEDVSLLSQILETFKNWFQEVMDFFKGLFKF